MAGLKIEEAELRVVRLPLLKPFTISTGTMYDKTFPLLILRGEGLEAYAESVVDPVPDYLDETIAASLDLLRSIFLPQIVGQTFDHPSALDPILTPWRGHYMTKAAVEMAVYDLFAKSLDLPLKTYLGGTGDQVAVGVSLGIMPLDETLAKTADHLAQGYKRIKLKIMPGHDVDIVEAVRQRFPDCPLSVDANSAYSLTDRPILHALDRFNLDYIEQPLAHDDIHDHATLQKELNTPLCLDESIRSAAHARKALTTDATRVINIKVGRVGGYGEAMRIHDMAETYAVPVWCGGMLESGIGRAHNIHLSTLRNFKKPGDTSSASRYFPRDIIHEKLETHQGMMPVPQGPGIGVSLDWAFLESVTLSKEIFKAS